MNEQFDALFPYHPREGLDTARVVAVTVGEGHDFDFRHVHAETFRVFGGAVLGKAEIEKEGPHSGTSVGPHDGAEPVLGAYGPLNFVVVDGRRPLDDLRVVHGGHFDVIVLKGENLYFIERFKLYFFLHDGCLLLFYFCAWIFSFQTSAGNQMS